MENRAKIYEFKAGVADRNSNILQSPDGKYIYWNEDKFRKNEVGDFVFFVNRYQKFAIYSKLSKSEIIATYNASNDVSRFNHDNNSYEVKGQWKTFIRFDIIQKVDISADWNWTRQLGQSEIYDLWKPKIKSIGKRIEKIDDLLAIFKTGDSNATLKEIRRLLDGDSHSIKLDLSKALADDWINFVQQSNNFVFEKGRIALNHFLEIKNDKSFFTNLRVKYLDETMGKDVGFIDFRDQYSKESNEFQIMQLAGKLISYIDQKAANKEEYNEYAGKRAMARSGVNQRMWFEELMFLKSQNNDYGKLKKDSVKNALLYLSEPGKGATMLSEKHREKVVTSILGKKAYNSDSFVGDLLEYFEPYDLKIENEENRTALLSSILYHDSIIPFWQDDQAVSAIQGLAVADNTGWQENFIRGLKSADYDFAVFWWEKLPVGKHKTIEALKKKIKTEGSFDFYFTKGDWIDYKAKVIDFALPEDYPEKNWNLSHNVLEFEEDVSNYKNEKSGKSANIIFLSDQFEKIDPPISRSAIKYYKEKPSLRNLNPFYSIKNQDDRKSKVKIWFVCQGSTYKDDMGKKYLWAPIKDKRGASKYYWDKMKEVKKGDVIFHYSEGLRGVSKAVTDSFPSINPMDNSQWKAEGYQVDVEKLYEFETKIHYIDLKKERAGFDQILKDLKSPFDTRGEVKQGYLFDFNIEAGQLVRQIYGQPFAEPFESLFKSEEKLKTFKAPKEVLQHIHQYILGKGYNFRYEDIVNFYLSLKTKPFVILAGISGAGKTQLVRTFTEAIGYKDTCSLVPVKPDWTDNSDLIGYLDLQQEFHPKKALEIILKAHHNSNKPYFLILDEMNLARVEYYFSDFLSIIETRERNEETGIITTDHILNEDDLGNKTDRNRFGTIGIPENLYVIGTVNMDETTHPFSRKVLDRANSIEMNRIDLDWVKIPEDKNPLNGVYNDFLKTKYLNSKDLKQEDRNLLKSEVDLLKDINDILKQADLHFAYRVRDEIAFYLLNNKKDKLLSNESAMDYQVMQKVLPRIQGSSPRIEIILKELIMLLTDGIKLSEKETYDEVVTMLKNKNSDYSLSIEKLLFMLKRYNDDGFTSFWQ